MSSSHGKKRAPLRIISDELLNCRLPPTAPTALNAKRFRAIERLGLKEPKKRKFEWELLKMNAVPLQDELDLSDFTEEELERLVEYLQMLDYFPAVDYDEGVRVGAEGGHLPRSFLLDAIHEAAAEHCLFKHSFAGKDPARAACPSPAERKDYKQTPEEFADFVAKARVLLGRTQKAFERVDALRASGNFEAEAADEDDEDSDNEKSLIQGKESLDSLDSLDSIRSQSSNTCSSDKNPDFKAIAAYLLEEESSLLPVEAYNFSYDDGELEFGADALWSLDSSALLAFGWAAEAFIERMIYRRQGGASEEEEDWLDDEAEVSIEGGSDSEDSWIGTDLDDDWDEEEEKGPTEKESPIQNVSNCSAHVPAQTLRALFAHFSEPLLFQHFPALARRDGSFECTVLYANLSSALLACQLSGVELGDRCIEVRLESGMKRFEPEFLKGAAEPTQRTLLMRSEDETLLGSLAGVFKSLELERVSAAEKRHFYLVEFETLAGAVEAWRSADAAVEAAKAVQLPKEATGAAEEAIKSPIEEVMIYGVPASKLLEARVSANANVSKGSCNTSSNSTAPSRSRSRSRDRYRRDSRNRSRSPRRDRDRERDEYRYRDADRRDYRDRDRERGRERDRDHERDARDREYYRRRK